MNNITRILSLFSFLFLLLPFQGTSQVYDPVKWAASVETFYYHDLQLDPGEYFLLRNMGLNLSFKRKW